MAGGSTGKDRSRKSASGAKKSSVRKSSTKKARSRAVKGNHRTGQRAKRSGRSSDAGHLFVVGEEERLDRLVEGFGNNRIADLLEVSRSQPSRWRSGKEQLGAASKRRVLDIDYVLSRLLQVYPRRQAEIWLVSYNAHLGGRPIDVLHLKGVAPVIEAIDAEAQGAFA